MGLSQTVNISCDVDEVARYDRLARSLSVKVHGAKVTRSAAIKLLIAKGWERLNELGEVPPEEE